MIKAFEKAVTRDIDILSKSTNRIHHNISNTELEIIKRLANMPEYTWKPADKGGAIVLLNTTDYIKEAERQLTNEHFYRTLNKDPVDKIRSIIRTVCSEGLALGYISIQTHEFLIKQFPRTPLFYMLPKIHKGIHPPPGRPIVSGIGSILEPIAKYVDHFLQPFVTQTKSYIKDTRHFINTVESLHIPEGAILMTLDITALYTSIPLEEARQVIKDVLDTRASLSPPTHFLMDLLDIVLENNYFKFGTQFYLQVCGVAMGSSLAPAIANLFVAYLETKFIYNSTYNLDLPDMIYYGRYIDDIFSIFRSDTAASHFRTWINTIHDHIKFTDTCDRNKINFLDVCVFRKSNRLYVKNYTKPTDRNSLLHFNSFHHHSLKSNLPYNQLLRLKRNTSLQEDFESIIDPFKQALKMRGYPERIVDSADKRAQRVNRSVLLQEQTKPSKDRIIWPLTLTPLSSKIKNIVNRHWHLIHEIQGCEKPPMVAHKRSRNFRNFLIHADLITPTTTVSLNKKGHYPCGHCNCCKQSLRIQDDIYPILHLHITLRHFTTCASENVIYLIICPCKFLYVGMTSRALRTRIQEHKSRIRNGCTDSTLYTHFQEKAHSDESFKFFVIEKVKPTGDNKRLLLQRESFWTFKFNSVFPKGLNDRIDFTCYL
uniref:Reverse transcriptase domain-containing protein n=1 Tax=Anolis carolinensis TaxID=28377 RepID=A0A803SUQ2_ANOCA